VEEGDVVVLVVVGLVATTMVVANVTVEACW
jgi:hypothetical protein